MGRLIGELMMRKPIVVKLFIDNKSAIALSKNPIYHNRSKHIDIRYHFIRSCLEDKLIEVEHISTVEEIADILTKALRKACFDELRKKLYMYEDDENTGFRGGINGVKPSQGRCV